MAEDRRFDSLVRVAVSPVSRRRDWWIVFAGMAVCLAIAMSIVGVVLERRELVVNYMHAAHSIEMAFNWVYCGQFSRLYDDGLAHDILHKPQNHGRSLADLVRDRHGSIEHYCANRSVTIVREDSGLFYLHAFLLWMRPGLRINGLYTGLSVLMIAFLVFFACAMLRVGLSPLVALGSLVFGIGIYGVETVHSYMSNHIFMWPPMFAFIGGLALVGYPVIKTHPWRSAVVLFALGALAGMIVNLRYSYVVYVASLVGLYALWLALGARTDHRTGSGLKSVVVAVAVLAVFGGFLVFDHVLITPLRARNIAWGRLTHPVFHPLVLALSIPPNGLAKGEGIRWNDEVGMTLAKRITGGKVASYQQYEDALASYYFGLWKQKPTQMLAVHLRKAHVAGVANVRFLARVMGIGFVSPFTLCFSGYLILLLLLGYGTHTFFNFMPAWSPFNHIIRGVVLIGLLSWVQSMLLVSTYSFFFPEFLFSVIILTIYFWEEVVRRMVRRRLSNLDVSKSSS